MKTKDPEVKTVMMQARFPEDRKRLFFSQLHLHGYTYRSWLQERIDAWLDSVCGETKDRKGKT